MIDKLYKSSKSYDSISRMKTNCKNDIKKLFTLEDGYHAYAYEDTLSMIIPDDPEPIHLLMLQNLDPRGIHGTFNPSSIPATRCPDDLCIRPPFDWFSHYCGYFRIGGHKPMVYYRTMSGAPNPPNILIPNSSYGNIGGQLVWWNELNKNSAFDEYLNYWHISTLGKNINLRKAGILDIYVEIKKIWSGFELHLINESGTFDTDISFNSNLQVDLSSAPDNLGSIPSQNIWGWGTILTSLNQGYTHAHPNEAVKTFYFQTPFIVPEGPSFLRVGVDLRASCLMHNASANPIYVDDVWRIQKINININE